jgi:TPR repeat protein
MLRARPSHLVFAALLSFAASPAFAAALDDGRDAYQKGDYATALKLLRPLADAGNPEAQVFIGMSYEFGDGVAKNTSEAVKWYRQAAEKGNTDAAYNLGTIYQEGTGVAKNIPEAVKWFRMAAAKGDPLSQRELGTIYRDGSAGVKRDEAEAAKWFRMATGKNDVPSMTALGEMYLAGRGVAADRKEAQDLLRRASELGDSDAKRIYDREFAATR